MVSNFNAASSSKVTIIMKFFFEFKSLVSCVGLSGSLWSIGHFSCCNKNQIKMLSKLFYFSNHRLHISILVKDDSQIGSLSLANLV